MTVPSEAPRFPPRSSVYAVGPAVQPGEAAVSGQKMMFQLAVDLLREWGWRVRVFDIGEQGRSSERRTKGRLSIARVRDYLRALPTIWFAGLFGPKRIVYLTTAQSLVGFLRDLVIIWPLSLRGHKIVCHQFGGNYVQFFSSQSRLVRLLIRKTLSRAAAVVVEGELVKEQLSFLPNWEHKVRVVHNGLPERGVEVPTEPKTIEPGEPVHLLYLSNMLETKGYWDVLGATEILLEAGRNVRCQFVGEFLVASDSTRFPDPDEARKAFFSYLDAHPELARVVDYERRLSGEAKAAAFRRAHVFLLPSNYVVEGQPVSVLEAMAHGCITIATEYRLIPLMVRDGETGFFVPYNDPRAIVDRVEHLIQHPEELRRMSAASVRRFEERFSAESYVRRLVDVLCTEGDG